MRSRGTRDFLALEKRRRRAASLLRRGISEAEVARRLGVSRQSVNRWAKALWDSGAAALRRAPKAGRKSRLDDRQLTELSRLLKMGAGAYGFGDERWTGPRFAVLVERECGVRYCRTRALELLRALQKEGAVGRRAGTGGCPGSFRRYPSAQMLYFRS